MTYLSEQAFMIAFFLDLLPKMANTGDSFKKHLCSASAPETMAAVS